MNQILNLFFILTIAFAINLQIGTTINLHQSYQLHSNNAKGEVTYYVQKLPTGIKLNKDKIQVQDVNILQNGYHTIKVRAIDQIGDQDQKLAMLKIDVKKIQEVYSQEQKIVVSQVTKVDKVNNILDDLLISTSVQTNYDYPQVGYPTSGLPTQPNSHIINFTPQLIASKQTIPTQKDRNIITEDSVKTQLIFQRQMNSAKAIANLLSIIGQATANKNQAMRQINKRNNIYKELKTQQMQVSQKVIQAQNQLQRLNRGIQTTNQDINNIRQQINNLLSKQQQKGLQKSSLKQGLQQAKKNYKIIDLQLQRRQRQLQQLLGDLNNKRIQSNELLQQITNANKQLGNKRIQQTQLNQQIHNKQKVVNSSQIQVNKLKQQLAQAQDKLQKQKQQLNILNINKQKLQILIKKIGTQLNNLVKRLQVSRQQSNIIKQNVDKVKNKFVPDLKRKIIEIQNEIQNLRYKYQQTTKQIYQLPNQISSLQKQLNRNIQNLRFLRSQSFIYQKNLRQRYTDGNLINQKLSQAQSNLNSARQRYQKQKSIIQSSTKNIQLARMQKQKADKAVQNHLKQKTNILPFASAPGQKGFQQVGIGKFSIKSWKQYIQVAYGKGVQPIYIGVLQSLYSFRLKTDSMIRNDERQCQKNNLKAVSGYILQVFDDSIMMITQQGDKYLIRYQPCTIAVSNIRNYRLQAGDIVVLKGQQIDNQINATQLTCIRR